jgi:hypothetical protein
MKYRQSWIARIVREIRDTSLKDACVRARACTRKAKINRLHKEREREDYAYKRYLTRKSQEKGSALNERRSCKEIGMSVD